MKISFVLYIYMIRQLFNGIPEKHKFANCLFNNNTTKLWYTLCDESYSWLSLKVEFIFKYVCLKSRV